MAFTSNNLVLFCVVGIVLLARPAHAFGAGNIASVSKVEGQNWRHGDIEDTLLSIVASRALNGKFGKLDVKRVMRYRIYCDRQLTSSGLFWQLAT